MGGLAAAVQVVAERYAKSDPDKALRCAEEMVVRAWAMDQPARTTGVAQAGQLVARLGNVASGRKLIEEAAAMIPRLGPQRNFEARGAVAQALAAYDVKRALALMPAKLRRAAPINSRSKPLTNRSRP